MKFLRTVSTRRLLASLAGVLVAVAAGTAIAVAASGSGPVPGKTSLAKAAHRALAAGNVQGIYARISFTDHLISSTDIQGSDPILTGASGRLWISSANRLRLELQADNGADAQIVLNGRSFWISEPSAHTVYEGTLPASTTSKRKSAPANDVIPSVAKIQAELNRIMGNVNLSGAMPGDIAGRPEYTVRVSPKHDGGLLGSAKLAWDAIRGVPLRFAIYARGSSTPVLELKATHISYGPVKASAFSIFPPAGAKVVKISMPTGTAGAKGAASKARRGRRARRMAHVSGVAAVSKRLPFKLDAPRSLVGLPRRGVSLLEMSGHPAALVTYGENLGGVAVIEQAAAPSASAAPKSSGNHDGKGLSLPTVSIKGNTGQELDTALGTLVRFTRGRVAFIVVGSVPAVAAEHAARGL
jgi:outer membrane lipoprotein-sorting protein